MELQATFCVNCGSPSGCVALEDEKILHCIQQWIAPRLSRYHILHDESHQHILNIVQNWIQPREVLSSDVICHRCFQRAEAALYVEAGSVNIPLRQNCERINLPNYARASETHSRCIFPVCDSTSQHLVPYAMRVRLFSDHKYYIPSSSRLESQLWSLLFEAENLNSFTAAQIEEFCELLKNDKNILDFQNIESMDSHLVWYWLGRTKQQFREIEAEIPEFENRNTALAAYLIKLRTGDSDERIASLFNKSRSTVNRLISKARNEMLEDFVPRHLGLRHITRRQVAERNLYIPESLFGNPGSSIEDRKAIVIMDGTYVYIEKSSNYSYQKKTYSLHKYRILVKPFLIVCCDGHIIDVLGPYPATASDANILKHEFNEPNAPLRQYY